MAHVGTVSRRGVLSNTALLPPLLVQLRTANLQLSSAWKSTEIPP